APRAAGPRHEKRSTRERRALTCSCAARTAETQWAKRLVSFIVSVGYRSRTLTRRSPSGSRMRRQRRASASPSDSLAAVLFSIAATSARYPRNSASSKKACVAPPRHHLTITRTTPPELAKRPNAFVTFFHVSTVKTDSLRSRYLVIPAENGYPDEMAIRR